MTRVRIFLAAAVTAGAAVVAVPQSTGATATGFNEVACATPLPAYPSALPFGVAPPCVGAATGAVAGVTTAPPGMAYAVAGVGVPFASGVDYWDVCLAPGAPSTIGAAAGMAVAGPLPTVVGPPGPAMVAAPYTWTRIGAVGIAVFGPDPAAVTWAGGEFAAVSMPEPLVGAAVGLAATPAHVCPNPGPPLVVDIVLAGAGAL